MLRLQQFPITVQIMKNKQTKHVARQQTWDVPWAEVCPMSHLGDFNLVTRVVEPFNLI